jgi:hypothetical protein
MMMGSSISDSTVSSMPEQPFEISDDEVLAIVCRLGRDARVDAVQSMLSERLRCAISTDNAVARLQRLRRAGLLRCFAGENLLVDTIRLTALGVERLQSLQREPLKPPTA